MCKREDRGCPWCFSPQDTYRNSDRTIFPKICFINNLPIFIVNINEIREAINSGLDYIGVKCRALVNHFHPCLLQQYRYNLLLLNNPNAIALKIPVFVPKRLTEKIGSNPSGHRFDTVTAPAPLGTKSRFIGPSLIFLKAKANI